VIRRVTLERFG